MSHSTGPPDFWQKLDDQMKQDSERTARVVGRICGLRVSSSAALLGPTRSQSHPRKSRSRNRRRRKRRIGVIEESTERFDAGAVSHLKRTSDAARVFSRHCEWAKWIWLMVLFVIWPELLGYIYVGFLVWICYRSLFHYYAAPAPRLRR